MRAKQAPGSGLKTQSKMEVARRPLVVCWDVHLTSYVVPRNPRPALTSVKFFGAAANFAASTASRPLDTPKLAARLGEIYHIS
jgi:hypothetical protein